MVEQICLVTGATSGIGRATAHELVSRGASVVIHGRRSAELDAAAADIRASTSNEKVTVLLADLASLGSVRQATDRFIAEHDRLHVLVNNAGVSLTHRSVTAYGYETTFAVNHLAPFLLTNLLLELLQNGAPSRIVNVTSTAFRRAQIDFDDLQASEASAESPHTVSRSSPTSCSPTSLPGVSRAPTQRSTACIRASCAPPSGRVSVSHCRCE